MINYDYDEDVNKEREVARRIVMHAVGPMLDSCANSYANSHTSQWLCGAAAVGAYHGEYVGTIQDLQKAWKAWLDANGGLPSIGGPSMIEKDEQEAELDELAEQFVDEYLKFRAATFTGPFRCNAIQPANDEQFFALVRFEKIQMRVFKCRAVEAGLSATLLKTAIKRIRRERNAY